MTGFRDLPRPKVGTPAAAPSGDGAPDAGAHPLIAHAPAHLRGGLARIMAGAKPYDDMTDDEKQAEAARLIKAEDAASAAGTQLDLGGHGAAS